MPSGPRRSVLLFDGPATDTSRTGVAKVAVYEPSAGQLLVSIAGRLQLGETLSVHSAGGGVGHAVVAVATVSGAGRVLGTVGAEHHRAAAQAAGYKEVLVRGTRLIQDVLAATDGQGVDLVLDLRGTGLLEVNLWVLTTGGRVVPCRSATGPRLGPRPPTGRLLAGNASLVGFGLARLAPRRPEQAAAARANALAHLAAGTLTLNVSVVAAVEGAAAAQHALADGHGPGKQVIAVA